ncbi:cytohesin-2 [Patellaria atrata CBS 101060]|uniref:Cytohesin-2 n=1 Tax=Patellaria atrata CBS 101060 TaxID=1346257 RepID=A0A9P4VRL3_9PEZI|nr:cytohesin-2 [Patellaria atrata CBS 101060]
MEEMEKERVKKEAEEKEKNERMKRIQAEFDSPAGQWEQDKAQIKDAAKKQYVEEERANVEVKEKPAEEDRPPRPAEAPIPIAVDPVALVVTECITVTSAMRKHARWAHSSVAAILGGGSSRPPPTPRTHKPKQASASSINLEEEDSVSRWGLRGKKGKSMQDNPLMAAFARLRADLKGCKDIRQFDTPALFHPFLQVIRSSSTSAPITSLALVAITKFLQYNIICRDSPRLSVAMQLLSSAITHCRFEATDSSSDEVVLLRILKLMEGMISGPGGDILGDESICEMMETGLSMCCQSRLSEQLRRAAEISMITMCQVIFERLKHLEIEAGEEPGALDEDTKDDMDAVKMDPTVNGTNLTVPSTKEAEARPSTSSDTRVDTPREERSQDRSEEKPVIGNINGSHIDLPKELTSEEDVIVKPYSLPSIRELLRVLVDLLDPHDRQHTDTMRIMGLRIVDVALEVAGPSIANHPSLASLAKDTLCRHLFQLVRSENMAILNESLRVAYTLIATCRGVLKLQQELFLSYLVACLFPKVDIPLEPGIPPEIYEGVPQAPSLSKNPPSSPAPNSGRSTPVPVKDRQKLGLEGGARKPDAREAMVESVGALIRIPSFMVELFVNYDCEIDRGDLCTDMVGLLSRNAFPDSATWSTTNVPPLCLDALLGYVQFIADRLDDEPNRDPFPDVEFLRQQRALKRTIIRGARKFNERPKTGIAYLASQGVIDDPNNPISVAKFCRATSRLDKKILGEFLTKRGNEEILTAFMGTFDFSGLRVDEALRHLLISFRLPGEAQLIDRIVTEFAARYCANSPPDGLANQDAVYVLCFAIIMLNTDQHNPNLKSQQRMAYTDFAKNLRGVNDGNDFDQEYLQGIYDSIKTNEIILPEEHDNRNAYDHAWKELQVKVQSAAHLAICDTNLFDADMFAATWKPIVATLSFVFMSASEDAVYSRVIAAFNQCAQIASRYGLTECLDRIVNSLSYISTLAPETPASTSLNTEVQVEKKSVMVSETAVRFGRDDRAQLATVVLFGVVHNNELAVRDGWGPIVRIILNLFVNALIPPTFSSIPKTMDLPPIPLQSPAQIIERGERPVETGLFSAFTSYVSSFATDEPPEPSEQEIEYTLCAIDAINSCNFDDIFRNISQMPTEGVKSLLMTLLEQIPEDSSPRVIVVKPDLPAPSPLRPNGTKAKIKKPIYDPSIVFVLELATTLVLRDAKTIEAFGKEVADALQTVIRDSQNYNPVVVSRTVYYLLCLLRESNDHDFIRAPVVLHTFSSFNPDLLNQCALPLLKGLSECIDGPAGLRSEMANSPNFWSILHSLASNKKSAAAVFNVVQALFEASQPGITADNYEAAISLLNEFATAGSLGAAEMHKREQATRKANAAKQALKKTQTSEVVVRGVKAVHMIHSMTSRVPYFIEQSHLEATEAWNAYWSPIFRALTTQCLNPSREVRQQAFSSLQRSLLSNDLASPEHKEWTAIFTEVLFPLITQLLKPEVWQSDPVGMSETRVQAATLLCKIFLHHLVDLSEWEGMVELWLRILAIMDRLMNSGQGEHLEEAVAENLKNILYVMKNGGYLATPEERPELENLWTETWKRLERFLPDLFGEVFPEEVERRKRAVEKKKEGEKNAAGSVINLEGKQDTTQKHKRTR